MPRDQSGNLMEKLVSLAKRRGFVYQSSEIYGGLNGCWDYGPLGVELLRNIKEQWWRSMTLRDDVEGIDAAILMHPRVWEASGHVEHFVDPMVDCRECKARFRADELEDSPCASPAYKGRKALACQAEGKFTDARRFNLMFKSFIGPVEEEGAVVYLRPETAQGIYVNFLNVMSSSRQKVPFGIAQVGKAFRNEINTKNFLFRTREFEQMEMQYFVKPGTDPEWFEYWRKERWDWFLRLGMGPGKIRWNEHAPHALAHYAKRAFDIEYEFPFGWGEIEGIHNRTDYDLSRHQEVAGKSLQVFDSDSNEKFVPYIIETSAGASRFFLAFLVEAYREEMAPTATGGEERRVLLKIHPSLAPLQAAVLPLVNRDGMDAFAHQLASGLQKHFRVFYDDSGAIGRRYRRQDEVGTPYCFTVDSQTLQDRSVTVRDRDSMRQDRISADGLRMYLDEKLG